MRRILAFALVPLLLLTGCAERIVEEFPPPPPSPSPVTTIHGHYAPDNILFSIEEGGGFVAAQVIATELPHVIVYNDGLVIIGPTAWNDRFVGLPYLRLYMIGADGMRQLLSLAHTAGVGRDIDYGYPLVADVSTTTFRLLTSYGLLATHVYALDYDDGLDAAAREARQRLIDLKEALIDIESTLGPDVAGPASSYRPSRVAVISQPWDDDTPSDERTWPGPALPGQPLPLNPIIGEDNLSCVEAMGSDLEPVLAEADAATEETAWLWEGQRYRIWFRPLLPHESSCADL
jgi:hypothetical protein